MSEVQGVDSILEQVKSRALILGAEGEKNGVHRPPDYWMNTAMAEIEVGDDRLQPPPKLRTDNFTGSRIGGMVVIIPFRR